nr:unnamed protein product [Haemonchus contortus]
MLFNSFVLTCGLTFISTTLSLECYQGTVTMINNQNPYTYPVPGDCGPFVQFCIKNLSKQRQQNGDTFTTIVYGCDTPYVGQCRYDGCTYSFGGDTSCCCDSYLCNGSSVSSSNLLILFICAVLATGKLLL